MKAPHAGGRPRLSRHARAAGRVLIVLAGAGAGLLALAGTALAHVTITPGSAPQGSTAELTFKVPNEEPKAATVELQLQVPTASPIAQFLVKPVPGWTITVQTVTLAKPVVTDDGSFTTAVSEVTWKGGTILPGQYQDFSVSADPLPSGTGQLVFKAVQTYSNGDVVRWIDLPQAGQPEPGHPAPVLTLTPAGAEADAAPGAQADPPADPPAAPAGPAPAGPAPAWATGRFAANSSEPSGRNRGLPSPSAPRVSRTGACPGSPTSTRQMLVTYLSGSPAAVWTPAASQLPSGDSRSEVSRGIEANALMSVKLLTCLLSRAGLEAPYVSRLALSRTAGPSGGAASHRPGRNQAVPGSAAAARSAMT